MSGNKKLITIFFAVVLFLFVGNCKKKDEQKVQNLPVVTTINTSLITANSAVAGGIINNKDGLPIAEKGICFATSTTPTILNTKITTTALSDSFTVNINGLLPNTTYYVRAYATNNSGTSYGNQISFQTLRTIADTDTAVTMYVSGGFSNKLFALNASDGSIKWSAVLGGNVFSSPIYSNGMVYVGCSDNKLYAFDTLGNLRWSANTDAVHHECPVVANGIVYFPDAVSINAFNANTGALIWKSAVGGNNMVLKNEVIYTNNLLLYAIDANTGIKKWEYYTRTFLQPVVFDDRIYVPNSVMSEFLDVISTSTGTLLWSKAINFFELVGLNIKHGNIYCVAASVVTNTGLATYGLNMLDSATANVKFQTTRFDVTYTFSDNISPIFTDSLAVIPADNSISSYDIFTGQLLYTIPSGKTNSGPTIANNLIYFTQRETNIQTFPVGASYNAGFVYAFDINTKTMKWSKEFKDIDFFLAAPCIVTRSGKTYRGGIVSQ